MNENVQQTVFPTKFVEYLFAGQPILINAPDNSYLAEFVRVHQCAALVTSIDKNEIKSQIVHILTNPELAKELAQKALQTAALFKDTVQIEKLTTTLKMEW